MLAGIDPEDPVVAADLQRVAVVLEQRSRRNADTGSAVRERSQQDFAQALAAEIGDAGHEEWKPCNP